MQRVRTQTLAVLAGVSLIGCSAAVPVVPPKAEPEPSRWETAVTIVGNVREASIDVLAAISDDAPCRAEWRRLAAEATDALQRKEAIWEANGPSPEQLIRALEAAARGRSLRIPEDRRAEALLGRIAPALDATRGCVQRGGLTMEEWVELEARGRRLDPDALDPIQQEAIERLRPVA